MSGFWLRCDACNRELSVEVSQTMQLALRFKPANFRIALAPIHPQEKRSRCRSCGWVNVFVPSESAQGNAPTPNWREISLK